MANFTFGNDLKVSLGVQVSKADKGPHVSLKIVFINTGSQDLAVEPGWNLIHSSCGAQLISGPFLAGADCGSALYCAGRPLYHWILGHGVGYFLKVKAGSHVEEEYAIGQCDFSKAKPGLYTTNYEISFHRHNTTICKVIPEIKEDACYNERPIKAEESYHIPVKVDFEIPKELSGYTWYTDIYSMMLYSLPVIALTGAAYKMYHHHHADKSMHDV